MIHKNYREPLRTLTTTLLETEDYSELYEAVQALHRIFSETTQVYAGNITDKDINLETGKAVSTIKAAHCLLEIERTRRFLRGTKKAIDELLMRKSNGPVEILYAGCGPYATLLTPLTSIYSASEVRFTLLDINPVSLNAAKTLYQTFGLTAYIKDMVVADATLYSAEKGCYDLMISETMLNALRNEPQVSIARNLIPQLAANGIFIPQQITVTAALLSSSEEMNSFFSSGMDPERILLGTVYQCGQPFVSPQEVCLDLPEIDEHHELALLTEIDTYGGEFLKNYSCSLSQPYRLTSLEAGSRFRSATFNYNFCESPHFSYRLIENSASQAG